MAGGIVTNRIDGNADGDVINGVFNPVGNTEVVQVILLLAGHVFQWLMRLKCHQLLLIQDQCIPS